MRKDTHNTPYNWSGPAPDYEVYLRRCSQVYRRKEVNATLRHWKDIPVWKDVSERVGRLALAVEEPDRGH